MIKLSAFAGICLGLSFTAAPAHADEKPVTTHESKKNSDGTLDTKTVTTKRIGAVTDTRTTEKTTKHNLGGGTTRTVDKSHTQTSPGHKKMKRHHSVSVKRDASGKAVEISTKSE